MGLAIIIRDADFSAKNLGMVEFLQDVNVTAIKVNGLSSYSGLNFKCDVEYTPSNTSRKGVAWAIISGNEYAAINSATGVVTINSNANGNKITIKATSTYDSEIFGTKEVSVTYQETVDELASIAINAPSAIQGEDYKLECEYTPSNTNYKGVIWSIENGSQYASINSSTGLLTINSSASGGSVTIKATSTHDSSLTATKTISVTYKQFIFQTNERIGLWYMTDEDIAALESEPYDVYLEFASDTEPLDRMTTGQVAFRVGKYDTGMYQKDRLGWFVNWGSPEFMTRLWNSTTTDCIGFGINSYGNDLKGGYIHVYDNGANLKIKSTTYATQSRQYVSASTASPERMKDTNFMSIGCGLNISGKISEPTDAIAFFNSAAYSTEKSKGTTSAVKIRKFIIAPTTNGDRTALLADTSNAIFNLAFDANGNPYNAGKGGKLYSALISELD